VVQGIKILILPQISNNKIDPANHNNRTNTYDNQNFQLHLNQIVTNK